MKTCFCSFPTDAIQSVSFAAIRKINRFIFVIIYMIWQLKELTTHAIPNIPLYKLLMRGYRMKNN